MAFVYVPKRKVVSVWRPVEFMVSKVMSNINVELIKVKILRGGELKAQPPVLFREFYVSYGEESNGEKLFKFDVSVYVRDGVELFDGVKPMTLGERVWGINQMMEKRLNSSIPFKVEVEYYVKNGDGVLELSSGNNEVYPSGGNEFMYGVNHSPVNGDDMYMSGFYPSQNGIKAKILSNWRSGKVFKCGFRESLFVAFWIGDNLLQGVRVRRYQKNGIVQESIYQWYGIGADGSNENAKVLVSNIGVIGINGVLNGGVGGLIIKGNGEMIDSDTVRYEVQFISNLSEIIEANPGVPNDGNILWTGFDEITETVEVWTDFCENGEFKRVHWMNRLGGMDSRTFRIFARRSLKVKSQRNRKKLEWNGNDFTPNDRSYRGELRKNIESVLSYEIEDIIENEEGIWMEELLESPCLYMEDESGFMALSVEDSEIVPSDSDDGVRVIKIKFIIDNVNVKIE